MSRNGLDPSSVSSVDVREHASAGFTLIELLIALALFALISLAGVSLVETVIGVQDRTAGRAQRLAEIQRGLYAASTDFEALTSGPAREGDRITLTRSSRDGELQLAYVVRDGALHRIANGTDRVLLSGVRSAAWRFLKEGIWTAQPSTPEQPDRPAGVELSVDLAPTGSLGGSVRRVIELPREVETP